ncbi:MAG: TetR/AcrR family transcriptional regulator [Burkholderiaceae bacterium]|nr:TetR/AcrR family transcriptional regulator [Burkholderiaceae bacterium]
MARTRSEQYPEIQQNILKRAARVFASAGYATSTISDLASATDLSRGALYHYFQSKEAILCGILDDHLLAFLEMVDEAMRTSRVAVEQLRNVTRAIVEFNAQSPDEQILVLNDVNQLSGPDRERIKALQRQILDRLSDLLIRVDVAGTIAVKNKRVYTMLYLGIVNYTFAWYDPKGGVPPAELAGIATDLFLHGLLGSASAAATRTS